MGVISVRLDNDTEARLKREALAQGVSFSDFLRRRLTGEQQEPVETAREKPVETARGESAETVLSALRQIADFLRRMEQGQRESGYFTQRLVFNALRVLCPVFLHFASWICLTSGDGHGWPSAVAGA